MTLTTAMTHIKYTYLVIWQHCYSIINVDFGTADRWSIKCLRRFGLVSIIDVILLLVMGRCPYVVDADVYKLRWLGRAFQLASVDCCGAPPLLVGGGVMLLLVCCVVWCHCRGCNFVSVMKRRIRFIFKSSNGGLIKGNPNISHLFAA